MGFFIVCLIIGVVVGFVVVSAMKSQLNSVSMRDDAHAYLAPESLVLTHSTERFLYVRTTRTARPKSK